MTTMTATNGDVWKISGVTMIPQDSSYQIILEAINSGHVEQTDLQKKLGYFSPIVIDYDNHIIDFCRF